jgi:hypothetical protein
MAQTVAVKRSKHENKQPLKQPPMPPVDSLSKRGRQTPRPIRGVFEHPLNSGIWWSTITLMGNVIAKKSELAKRLPISTASARTTPEWE